MKVRDVSRETNDDFQLSELEDRAAALVEAAKKAGADHADAVVAASRATGVEVRNGEIEETESAENKAFSLRVFVGKRSASISSNDPSDVVALAERAVSMAKVSPEDEYAGLAPQDLLATSKPDLDLFDDTEISFDEMREQALACEEAALAVEGVTQSSGSSFGRSLGGSVLATSNGFVGSYRASRCSLSATAVAGEGTSMEREYDFDSQRHKSDLRDAVEIGHHAGERAVKNLNAKQVPTQTTTVVFEPRMARSLVSHIAGAINGASVARKTSFLRDRMGEQVFSKNVSLVDEPHLERGVASKPFDAEGVAFGDLSLINSGVLEHWFLDCAAAKELGLTSNGRANRSGSGTSPGSTNLTLQAGRRNPQDIISELKEGFYVTQLIGQGVNLITGDYSRGASGFWIKNGELTFAVSEITIAGNLTDMFQKMEPANDLDKRHGTNTPTIVVEGMTLAGR